MGWKERGTLGSRKGKARSRRIKINIEIEDEDERIQGRKTKSFRIGNTEEKSEWRRSS